MLLGDMTKHFRFLLAGLAAILSLMPIHARAQSARQNVAFSVLAQYQFETNDVPDDPTVMHDYFHLILINSSNVVKAIAVDQFGTPDWTNWANAALVHRINLVTGEEGMFLSRGPLTNEFDVSSYFSGSYVSNFMSGTSSAFPAATNNFESYNPDPYQPLFYGSPTNHKALAGMYFISLNTTNLKMNLLGVNFGSFALGNGVITQFSGNEDGTNYSGEAQNGVIFVVGSLSWTRSTNLFDIAPGTNTFYSGPARGTVTLRVPAFSKLAAP
jgi:hypothetical protein